MSSTTCPSCNAGINQELFLAWLSKYCQLVPGWNGLSSNWDSALPSYEILDTGQINEVSALDSAHFQTNNPFTSQFITDKHTFIDDHHLPTCTSGCNWLNSKWTSSFVDGNVASGLDGGNGFQPNYRIGGAPQSGTLYVDLSVFCLGWVWADLQSNCTGLCNAGLEPTSLLLWLNSTCGQITGFTGLPDDWHDSLAIVNSTFSKEFPGPSCLQGVSSPNSDCSINATESSCTKTLCGSQDQNGDCSAVSMVDMQCFCSQVKYSSCVASGGPCSSDLDETGLLLWLNGTCGSVAGFPGMPSNWTNALSVINSTYSEVDSFLWPSCLSAGNYPDCQLKSAESNCTRALCNGIDVNGDCYSVSMVDMSCFCSDVKYGTSCTRNCALSWERGQLLKWLNDTCSLRVPPGASLPLNWTSLLSIQRSEMLPWRWQLTSDLPPGDPSRDHCPSASSKLLAFAAVNFAMFLLIPIIGRRTVIKKLTFGYFGRQESQRWYYTGPVGVGLHLASNAINASIIKETPGFEGTSIKNLTFFWCTRPRISWLIVALAPYQAERSMYLSAIASILFSEVILQFFAGYYMIVGANYARKQKFFFAGHLVGSWYAKEAMIMYAGSMLWLTAVPFAIVACLWSVLGVSERIGRLGEYWTETTRMANMKSDIASTQARSLRTLKSKLSPVDQGPWKQQVERLRDDLSTVIDSAVGEWDGLKVVWNRMPTELRREQNNRRAIKKEVQKARERLERCGEGTRKWQERWQAARDAEQDEIAVDQEWFTTTCETRQNEARAHQAKIDVQIAADKKQKDGAQRLLAACERNMLPFEHAIAGAETKIKEDDTEMERIKSEQKSHISTTDRHKILELRTQYELIIQQRTSRLEDLEAAMNNPQLGLERNRVGKLQTLLDSWDALVKLKRSLRQNWAANEDQWRLVAERRDEQRRAAAMKPKVGHFPIVVLVGMLLCWIAQWLWWAGYVGVEGDGYCPPKLPVLASIWTIFSSMGKSHCHYGNNSLTCYRRHIWDKFLSPLLTHFLAQRDLSPINLKCSFF